MRLTHARDERGQGGLEVLPFGFLVLVAGVLLVVNVWAVVDAKLATEAASREAARAYVEAPSAVDAYDAAVAAGREALAGHHRDPDAARFTGPDHTAFVRCNRITWAVAYDVPSLTLPFIGGFGPRMITARSAHSEVVDPYRSGVPVDPDQGVSCDA